jgi:ABC-2 type transport system permease protein
MDALAHYLRLLVLFVRTELQYALAYRANLVVEVVGMAIEVSTSLAAVLILFTYAGDLNGWTLPEMLVLLGVFYVLSGASDVVFYPSMTRLMEHVRQGTLDFTLLKPADSQFLVSLRQYQIVPVTQILLGLLVIGMGIARMGERVTLGDGVAFVLALGCGVVLIYAVLLVLATLSFWFVRVDNIMVIFGSFMDASRFPVDVYPGWLRITLSSVIPVGLAVTIPAEAIGGRLGRLGLAEILIGALAAAAFARWFWRQGLKNYTGASA